MEVVDRIRRGRSLRGDQAGAEREAQVELEAGQVRPVLQRRQQLEAARQVGDRLEIGRAPGGDAARAQPVRRRLLALAGFAQVVGEGLGLGGGDVGELGGERGRDRRVQLASPPAQHAGIGGVAQQRMPEEAVGVGWRAAHHDEARRRELAERLRQRLRIAPRHAPQQCKRELAPQCRADLRDLAHRLEPVEPRMQRGVQRLRDRERWERAEQFVAALGFADELALEHGPGQFLGEQRHPVGAREDLLDDRPRQRLVAGDLADQRLAVLVIEPLELNGRDMRVVRPWRAELRPCRDQGERAPLRDALDQGGKQLERGWIDPVHVLEREEDGFLRGEPVERLEQHRKSALLAHLRGELGERRFLAVRNGQQIRDQRRGQRVVRTGEDSRHLRQFLVRRVCPADPGTPLDRAGKGVEGAIDVVGRAEIAQRRMRLPRQHLAHGTHDVGLADSRLSRQQHGAPAPAGRVAPAPHDEVDFLLPPE